jgi:cytochrome c oxidase subunit 3
MAPAVELPPPSATPARVPPAPLVNAVETNVPGETNLPSETGMWVFLVADVMGFAGLLGAYAALLARAPAWPEASAHLAPTLAVGLTLLLVASSATMSAAVAAARRSEHRRGRVWLAVTLTLGMAFVGGQLFEFRALLGAPAGGLSTLAPAAALFFVLTGYHGVHVLVGVVVLARLAMRAHAGAGSAGSAAGALTVASLYWQFVDVVWLVLFAALYLLPAVALFPAVARA